MIKTYKFDDETLLELIEKDKKFELVLPHFQRRFVWEVVKDQKPLLQSMLSGVPVGGVLLLEGKKDDYVSRPLCFNKLEPKIPEDKCVFLLDGQQRMSTMKSMFCDLFSPQEIERFSEVDNWQGLLAEVPAKLHNRWFINIDDERDIFGLKKLYFDENKQLDPYDFDECIDFYKIYKSKNKEYNPANTNENLVNWSVTKKLMPLCLLSGDRYSFKEVLKRVAGNKFGESKDSRKIEEWAEKITVFLEDRTLKTDIHEILLGESGMQIGISIFEQVNRGGVKLDIYDLIVARMAFHKKNLTDEIRDICKEDKEIIPNIDNDARNKFQVLNLGIWDDKDDIPSKSLKKAFKNCLAICELKNNKGLEHLTDKYIKERNLLNLDKDQIFNNWKDTMEILFSVFQFLHFRCGVAKLKDIPYELLIVPLFVFFAKHDNKPSKKDIDKIEFWYWASIFSGHYREKQSTRVIQDSKKIINGESFENMLSKIFKEDGYSDKDSLTRKKENGRQSQLDRTLIQYVISKEPYDFSKDNNKNKQTKISAYKIAAEEFSGQIHHIIPLNEIGDSKKLRKDLEHPINSALNKVVISAKANLLILRIDDYKKPANHLNLQCNFIPKPNDKKYNQEKYNLADFLSDRFDLLEKDIKDHLERLITD
jgi:hypothetical protein